MDLPLLVCEDIESRLGAHLDHELARAEEARIEAHLDVCPRCRARREYLEVLSGTLKGWEADTLTPVLPDLRLQNTVLARVAATSHQRRVDGRVLRITHALVAASVLFALGLGIVFGMRHEASVNDDRSGAAGTEVTVQVDPALAQFDPSVRVSADRFDAAALLPRSTATVLAAPHRAQPVFVPLPRIGVVQDATLRLAAAWHAYHQRGLELEGVTGERSVVLFAARPGEPERVFFPSALSGSPSLRRIRRILMGGAPSLMDPASVAPAPAERTTPLAALGLATDRNAKDLLSPLGSLLEREVDADNRPPLLMYWPPARNGDTARAHRAIEVRGIFDSPSAPNPRLTSTDGAEQLVKVQDPLAAQSNKILRLVEDGSGRLNLVVHVSASDGPIYIPAGQVIRGGVSDRVTSVPLWIPVVPAGKTLRFQLACLPIQRGAARSTQSTPTLTRFIVGPTLRGLIAKGATPGDFLAAVETQFKASGATHARHGGFSLLTVLLDRRTALPDSGETFRRVLAGKRWSGFLFTDGEDHVLGMEVVRFGGAARGRLLARLWAGYYFEAWLRNATGPDASAGVAAHAASLPETMRLLRDSTDTFFGKSNAELLRVSQADIEHSTLGFQAVEMGRRRGVDQVDYAPVHVSGMPRLPKR